MKVALIDNARLLGAIVAAHLVELGHRVERVTAGEAFRVLLRRHTPWSAFVVAVDGARLPPVLRLLRCADRDAPIVAVVGRGLVLPEKTIAEARRLTLLYPPVDREVLGAALASNADRTDTARRRAPGLTDVPRPG